MEQIYTIPVNEKFEASAAEPSLGCPFCALFRMLEENELDLILGASMMEPDVRIKTNELGFCMTHYNMMFERKNRLGLALMLESHLAEQRKALASGGLAGMMNPGSAAMRGMEKLEDSCYVCGRIDYNFTMMIETAALLWDTDEEFRKKVASAPYFCLPHYKRFLQTAKNRLQKKKFAEFYRVVSELELSYYDEISDDISWFCKKFDYRYEEEPWYNAKDAVPRAIAFISGDIHRPAGKS